MYGNTTTANHNNITAGQGQGHAEAYFEYLRQNFKKYQLVPLSFILVIGLVANSVVIFSVVRRRKFIKHYSNYFVLSMAVADWSVMFFTVPLMFVEYLVGFKWMSEFICQYILQIRETFQGAAIFSISTLAILRVHQVIKNPLGQFSQRTCRLLVAGIWVISFLVCTVPLFDIYRITPSGLCDPVWPSTLRVKIHVTVIYCIILSPMVVSTIAYGIVIVKVTHMRVLCLDPESAMLGKRNRNTAMLLSMLILSCWISYTPLGVFLIISINTNIETSILTMHIIALLFLGGSALNPVLVLLTMPKLDYHCPDKEVATTECGTTRVKFPLEDRNTAQKPKT